MRNTQFISLAAMLIGASVIGANVASAAPYTAYFEGVVAFYRRCDVKTIPCGPLDPAKAGKVFSGWVTFDIANAKVSGRGVDQNGFRTYATAWTYRAEPRVVTGYSLSAPFAPSANYQPIIHDADWLDSGGRANTRFNPRAPNTQGRALDVYHTERLQTKIVGNHPSTRTFDERTRRFDIDLVADNNALLRSVFDLNAEPKVGRGGVNQFLFEDFHTYGNCVRASCKTFFSPDSFIFVGPVTSLYVLPGNALRAYSCEGFRDPFGAQPILNPDTDRSLPLETRLLNGTKVVGPELIVAPIADVRLVSSTAVAKDGSVQSVAPRSGDPFRFDASTGTWTLNLSTRPYTTPGAYQVMLRSGDRNSYFVSPPCVGTFVRQ